MVMTSGEDCKLTFEICKKAGPVLTLLFLLMRRQPVLPQISPCGAAPLLTENSLIISSVDRGLPLL